MQFVINFGYGSWRSSCFPESVIEIAMKQESVKLFIIVAVWGKVRDSIFCKCVIDRQRAVCNITKKCNRICVSFFNYRAGINGTNDIFLFEWQPT